MLKVKKSYAPGEYPWTQDELNEVREATYRALEEAESQTKLSRWCGTTRANIGAWKRFGYIPPAHVIAVSEATGIKPTVLRPDLYRKPKSRKLEYQQY